MIFTYVIYLLVTKARFMNNYFFLHSSMYGDNCATTKCIIDFIHVRLENLLQQSLIVIIADCCNIIVALHSDKLL